LFIAARVVFRDLCVTALSHDQVLALIPHRDPFLWIDAADAVEESRIVARKWLSPDLPVFQGHYPGQPIFPGVLLCEIALQAGALLIAHRGEGDVPAGKVPVVTRLNNVKFRQMVRPGETVVATVEIVERAGPAFFCTGKLTVAGKTAATVEFAVAVA
jgi:3-hydroxyacyl-[acyl-carrier-protein] dehydratase